MINIVQPNNENILKLIIQFNNYQVLDHLQAVQQALDYLIQKDQFKLEIKNFKFL